MKKLICPYAASGSCAVYGNWVEQTTREEIDIIDVWDLKFGRKLIQKYSCRALDATLTKGAGGVAKSKGLERKLKGSDKENWGCSHIVLLHSVANL